MPVVWGRSRDDINVFVFEQSPHVGESFHRLAFFAGLLGCRFEDLRIAIAESGEPHPFHVAKGVDMARAPAAEANDGDADVAVRASHLGPTPSGQAQATGGEQRALEKAATINVFHRGKE